MYIARFALCPYSVDIQVCFALQLTWYYAHYCRDLNFTSHLLDCVMPLLFHPHTSTALFHSITSGLELMVITFALMVKDRTSIASTAASRYPPGMNRPSTLVWHHGVGTYHIVGYFYEKNCSPVLRFVSSLQ